MVAISVHAVNIPTGSLKQGLAIPQKPKLPILGMAVPLSTAHTDSHRATCHPSEAEATHPWHGGTFVNSTH